MFFAFDVRAARTHNANRYCVVGIVVLSLGVVYWAVWRIVLPKVFKYELYPTKETLSDGTVVTVVSQAMLSYDNGWRSLMRAAF